MAKPKSGPMVRREKGGYGTVAKLGALWGDSSVKVSATRFRFPLGLFPRGSLEVHDVWHRRES